MTIQQKADRDDVRRRASRRGQMIETVRRILRDYREGRPASTCMAEIEKALRGDKP